MLLQLPLLLAFLAMMNAAIELRGAPWILWIKDLSQSDHLSIPGLPSLSVLPLLMGVTMFLQQKLNPPPPDPVQAKLFQFMPIMFTFMLAGFPAGLVIYWSWNNLLSIAQQWLIMRQTSLDKPKNT